MGFFGNNMIMSDNECRLKKIKNQLQAFAGGKDWQVFSWILCIAMIARLHCVTTCTFSLLADAKDSSALFIFDISISEKEKEKTTPNNTV